MYESRESNRGVVTTTSAGQGWAMKQRKRSSAMGKDAPYHTNSLEEPPEQRSVHHDHNACSEGKKIRSSHREPGTGGKPLCETCKTTA